MAQAQENTTDTKAKTQLA